jgi:hypothetical protein
MRRKPPTGHKSLTKLLSYNVVSSTPRHERNSNSQRHLMIGTDCIGSCKSNNHTITTTKAPYHLGNTLQNLSFW